MADVHDHLSATEEAETRVRQEGQAWGRLGAADEDGFIPYKAFWSTSSQCYIKPTDAVLLKKHGQHPTLCGDYRTH